MPGVGISQNSAAIGQHRAVEMHISCQRCINTAGQCIQVASWLCSLFASSSSSSSSYPRLQGAPCQHTHTQTTASLMQLHSFLAPLAYPGSPLLFLLAFSGLALYLQKKFLHRSLAGACCPIMTRACPATFSWQGSISNSIHVIHRYDSTLVVHTVHAATPKGEEKKPKPIKPHPSRWILAAG